jgi:hypothetical protein
MNVNHIHLTTPPGRDLGRRPEQAGAVFGLERHIERTPTMQVGLDGIDQPVFRSKEQDLVTFGLESLLQNPNGSSHSIDARGIAV